MAKETAHQIGTHFRWLDRKGSLKHPSKIEGVEEMEVFCVWETLPFFARWLYTVLDLPAISAEILENHRLPALRTSAGILRLDAPTEAAHEKRLTGTRT